MKLRFPAVRGLPGAEEKEEDALETFHRVALPGAGRTLGVAAVVAQGVPCEPRRQYVCKATTVQLYRQIEDEEEALQNIKQNCPQILKHQKACAQGQSKVSILIRVGLFLSSPGLLPPDQPTNQQ